MFLFQGVPRGEAPGGVGGIKPLEGRRKRRNMCMCHHFRPPEGPTMRSQGGHESVKPLEGRTFFVLQREPPVGVLYGLRSKGYSRVDVLPSRGNIRLRYTGATVPPRPARGSVHYALWAKPSNQSCKAMTRSCPLRGSTLWAGYRVLL